MRRPVSILPNSILAAGTFAADVASRFYRELRRAFPGENDPLEYLPIALTVIDTANPGHVADDPSTGEPLQLPARCLHRLGESLTVGDVIDACARSEATKPIADAITAQRGLSVADGSAKDRHVAHGLAAMHYEPILGWNRNAISTIRCTKRARLAHQHGVQSELSRPVSSIFITNVFGGTGSGLALPVSAAAAQAQQEDGHGPTDRTLVAVAPRVHGDRRQSHANAAALLLRDLQIGMGGAGDVSSRFIFHGLTGNQRIAHQPFTRAVLIPAENERLVERNWNDMAERVANILFAITVSPTATAITQAETDSWREVGTRAPDIKRYGSGSFIVTGEEHCRFMPDQFTAYASNLVADRLAHALVGDAAHGDHIVVDQAVTDTSTNGKDHIDEK